MKARARGMLAARRGRTGAVSGVGVALGMTALLGGLGLLAAGANRRQQAQPPPEAEGLSDLDRELEALGLSRHSYDPGSQGDPGGPSLRLEQGDDGILRPVITMPAETHVGR